MRARANFGRYALLKRLGRDALGEIYRAAIEGPGGLERLVLLRLFNGDEIPATGLWPHSKERSALLTLLSHPFIADGVEHGTEGRVAYSAYEYIPGQTLTDLGRRAADALSPIPVDIALLISDRLAQALDAAAQTSVDGQRVLHGCVVPQLVVVGNEGQVRLLGFEVGLGLRQLAATEGTCPWRDYLSADATAGHPLTPQDDVYCLGALLLELLTGQPPPANLFASRDRVLAAARLAEDDSPLPDELIELLRRSFEPTASRIATPSAWQRALTGAQRSLGLEAVPFHLAYLIHNLFGPQIEREARSEAAERAEWASGALQVAPALLEPVSPVSGAQTPPPAARKGPSTGLLAAAAVVLLAGVGAGAFLLGRGGGGRDEDQLAGATSSASVDSSAGDAAAETDPAAAAQPPSISHDELRTEVDRLMAQRALGVEEQLQQQYSDRIAQLQAELMETQEGKATPPAEPGDATAATGGAGARERTPTPPRGAALEAVGHDDLVEPGPGVVPPRLTHFDEPSDPRPAEQAEVEGTVVLALLVDENGQVQEVRLVRQIASRVGLTEAAERAARRARFQPATKDGVPVRMWYTLSVPSQRQ